MCAVMDTHLMFFTLPGIIIITLFSFRLVMNCGYFEVVCGDSRGKRETFLLFFLSGIKYPKRQISSNFFVIYMTLKKRTEAKNI